MKHNFIMHSVLVGTLAISGCTSPSPFQDWSDDEIAAQTRAYLDAGAAPAYRIDTSPPAERYQLQGVESYVDLAMNSNPQINAAKQKVERLKQRIDQVTSLDDPMVTFASGDMAETAAGQVDYIAGVSQRFPYPGKQNAKGQVAAKDVVAAEADLQRVKLRIAGDVRRAYWRYYYTTRGIEITEQSMQLVTSFQETAESMLRAGRANQEHVLRASVELTDLESRIVVLTQQKQTTVAMLGSLLNLQAGTQLPPPPTIEFSNQSLELDELLQQAQKQNPELGAARARVAGFRERWELADLDAKPDFLVGFNYGEVGASGLAPGANGDDQWSVMLGMTLPIWADKEDAARSEALRGISEKLSELQAAQNRVAFKVQDSLARVQAQRQLIALFEERMIPEAQQAVDVSIRGYRAGGVEFLSLIENWKQLLRFELMQQQNLTRMEQALADLREAVGGNLPNAELSQKAHTEKGSVD
jgi:cobalt-zinc-cadmium efflux system outer membrane protein